MATTMYFGEEVHDQGGKGSVKIELGRSSYYSGCEIPGGKGEDSIYISIDDKFIVMDRATAKKFVEGVMGVGEYHGLID